MQSYELLKLLTDVKVAFSEMKEEVKVKYNEILSRISITIQKLEGQDLKDSKKQTELCTNLQEKVQDQDQMTLIDFYVLDYDFQADDYCVVGSQSEKNFNDRNTILNLVISTSKNHIQEKQKSKSMTQLHKLTSNPPQESKVLILPNYISEIRKYIYIYETKECVMKLGKYYLIDRYYCFVAGNLCLQSIESLFKKIKLKAFSSRLLTLQSPQNVQWDLIHACFQNQFNSLQQNAKLEPLKLYVPEVHPFLNEKVTFHHKKMENGQFPLVLLLFFFICKEFKLIILSKKQKKQQITPIILSIEAMFSPLQYLYPVIYSIASKKHLQFIQSPVPLIMHYWGTDKNKKKVTQHCIATLKKQDTTDLRSVILDLQSMKILFCSDLELHDTYVIEKLMNYLHKYGKGEGFGNRIVHFFQNDILLHQSQSEWVSILRKSIYETQMYQVWKNNDI